MDDLEITIKDEDKPRVLWVCEYSMLNTGFSSIGYEVLKKMYGTEKYEIAELACYLEEGDFREEMVPWKVFPVIPRSNEKRAKFNQDTLSQFGSQSFEDACLEFKPTHVISSRDHWMDEYIGRSPFRRLFKWIWMLTVDGAPQKFEWLDDYKKPDVVLTLSEFGKRVVEEESYGAVQVADVVRPGANHVLFKSIGPKEEIKKIFGLPTDSNIALMVSRNQPRKLFPQLIWGFKDFLDLCVQKGNKQLADNTYLYLHTSWPDVGYNIPLEILKSGISNKIYLTYWCKNCKNFKPLLWQGELTFCPFCKNRGTMMVPNTQHGLTREQLVYVYNIADVYIQYATAEGLSCTTAEAKSCGIPAMGLDHTAISEQVQESVGCIPIKVLTQFWENNKETGQQRWLPDNEDFVQKLYNFLLLSNDKKAQMGAQARGDVIDNYSLHRASGIFMKHVDQNPISSLWDVEPKFLPKAKVPTSPVDTIVLLDWLISNVLQEPEKIGTQWYWDRVTWLHMGYKTGNQIGGGFGPYSVKELIEEFNAIIDRHNDWENKRTKTSKSKTEVIII